MILQDNKGEIGSQGRVSEEGSSKTLPTSCDRAPMGAAIVRLAALFTGDKMIPRARAGVPRNICRVRLEASRWYSSSRCGSGGGLEHTGQHFAGREQVAAVPPDIVHGGVGTVPVEVTDSVLD